MNRDPGEIYRELAHEFGEPVFERIDAPATPAQKRKCSPEDSPQQIHSVDLAGEKIQTILTPYAPGNGAPIGGLKVIAEQGWFCCASVRHKKTSTKFMPRAFMELIIYNSFCQKRKPSSAMLWQRMPWQLKGG